MLRWVIPESCDKMLDLLAQDADKRDFSYMDEAIKSGLNLPPPSGIFPRLEMPADLEPDA
jgi:methionyl-tRNA synthetase